MNKLDRVQNDINMRKWIAFDASMPDRIIAHCIRPFIAVQFIRRGNAGAVVYYADRTFSEVFRPRIDRWERRLDREARRKDPLETTGGFWELLERAGVKEGDKITIPMPSGTERFVLDVVRRSGSLEAMR